MRGLACVLQWGNRPAKDCATATPQHPVLPPHHCRCTASSPHCTAAVLPPHPAVLPQSYRRRCCCTGCGPTRTRTRPSRRVTSRWGRSMRRWGPSRCVFLCLFLPCVFWPHAVCSLLAAARAVLLLRACRSLVLLPVLVRLFCPDGCLMRMNTDPQIIRSSYPHITRSRSCLCCTHMYALLSHPISSSYTVGSPETVSIISNSI